MIQHGSDVIALGVSELGFYSLEQHLLNVTIIKQILESPTAIPYFEDIFYFFLLTHMLSLCCRQLHELGEVCTLQGKMGMSSSESVY